MSCRFQKYIGLRLRTKFLQQLKIEHSDCFCCFSKLIVYIVVRWLAWTQLGL